jgi:hypothetical protein
VFVAIDRTSTFNFVQLFQCANRVTASAFLDAPVAAVPYRIHTVLTDNGFQFRFAPGYAEGPTARSMTHMFARRCHNHGIEYGFTKITHPWATDEFEQFLSALRAHFLPRVGDRVAKSGAWRRKPRRAVHGRSSFAVSMRARRGPFGCHPLVRRS